MGAFVLFSAAVISGCQPKKAETAKSGDGAVVLSGQPLAENFAEQLKALGAKLEYRADGSVKSVNLVGVDANDLQLAGLEQFQSLESLTVASFEKPNERITDTSIERLSGIKTLKSLDASGSGVTGGAFQKLNGLTSLSQLKMSGKLHGGFAGFAERFPSLTSVAFDRSDVNDDDLAEIVKVKRLNVIFLSNTAVTDKGIALLERLPALRNLRISNMPITDDGLKPLGVLKQLKNIDLSNTNVGNATLVTLGTLPQLERINLYMTKVTDDGIDAILPLRNIVWLNLDACQIGDVTIPKLTSFSKMTFLHLGKTKITDHSVDILKEMRQLKELHITETKITNAGAESLAAAMPHDCVLYVDKE
jgi:Leucine-rich repeat (LRR) protein